MEFDGNVVVKCFDDGVLFNIGVVGIVDELIEVVIKVFLEVDCFCRFVK